MKAGTSDATLVRPQRGRSFSGHGWAWRLATAPAARRQIGPSCSMIHDHGDPAPDSQDQEDDDQGNDISEFHAGDRSRVATDRRAARSYEYVITQMKMMMMAAAARQRPTTRSSRAVMSLSAIPSPDIQEEDCTTIGRGRNHTAQK
jgi:hypothetical protein